jgi:outer membrane PBP1 activator LpoA protein
LPEQIPRFGRIAVPEDPGGPRGLSVNSRGLRMKLTSTLAIALALGALTACNKSPNEQAADNIEANADNTADMMEANVDNAADMMQANTENAADAVRNAGDNTADAVRDAGTNTAQ